VSPAGGGLRGWGSSLLLWLASLATGAFALLPVVYLLVRAAVLEPSAALALLLRESTAALLLRSLGLAASVSALSVLLALALALCTAARDMPGRRLFVVLTTAPLAIPCYVGASAYLAALSPLGPLGRALLSLGTSPPRLHGFFGAVFVLTLFSFPLAYLPLRAALRRTDGSAFEAARVLGASPLQAFVVGVWPSLRPGAVAGATLVALYSLSELGAVALLRFDVFARVIFVQLTSAFDRTGASVLSLLLVACIVLVLALSELAGRTGDAVATDRGRPFAPRLRGLRFAAAAFASLLTLLTLGVPALALGYWLLARGLQVSSWLPRALGVSVASGLAAALACAALALPLAFVLQRRAGIAPKVLARAIDVGFALPGLVVALGLSSFALGVVPALYGGWSLLLLGYVILFLSLSLGALRGVLARIPPSLEEAARVLGLGPAAVLRRVTLPLVGPGLLAGGALVALSAMKELSLTLLVIPAGESTLATRLWSYTDEGMYAEAALPGALLIVVAAVGLTLLLRREGGEA
jgi:iron(III) transport system permease protein